MSSKTESKQIMRIGRHMGSSWTWDEAIADVKTLGYNFLQLFLLNPQKLHSKPLPESVLLKLKSALETNKVLLVVHGSYTINLCQPKSTFKYKTSMKLLLSDLKSAEILGPTCIGIIIHMGKNIAELKQSDETALNNYAVGLSTALKATSISIPTSTIILETGASQGHEVGSKLEDLCQNLQ